jgi:hypothetical protein
MTAGSQAWPLDVVSETSRYRAGDPASKLTAFGVPLGQTGMLASGVAMSHSLLISPVCVVVYRPPM